MIPTEKEWEAIKAYQEQHRPSCTVPPRIVWAMGLSRFRIEIRENTVAHTVGVYCDCGDEFNATDYDCW